MQSYNAPDLEDFSSNSIDDIVSYCEENRESVNFYRVTGPIDHWITAVEKKVWGFSSQNDYESVEEGDVLLFHATNNAANSDLTSKKSGLVGVGIVSKMRTKDEPWWWAEHSEGDEWQYIVEFEPMLITGSPEDIDRSKEITEKSLNEIEKETFALLENFMPMSRAGEICNEINGKDFPTMGSRSGFRDQNGEIDTEAPIQIIKEIESSLSKVDASYDSRSKLSDADNTEVAGEVPEEVKNQVEKMVQNSENNRGSFTRLYGVKAYFDLEKSYVTDEELKESVNRNYQEDYPGTKGAYLQNRHKAFQRDEYAAFHEADEGYQLKSEYEDYRQAIKSYVDRVWKEATSDINYFVISHNSKEEQFEEEYLQAPYTEDSEDYEGSYQPSHDLSKISKGDKILHYRNKHFVGISEARKKPEIVEDEEGNKKFYLDVDIQKFDTPRSLNEVRDVLREEKENVDKYYVLNSEGGKSEGYLKKITRRGFDYVLSGDHKSDIQVDEELSTDLDLDFEDLYFPENEAESIKSQIKASLNSGKHIIFTGPPGTGKTELAEIVAKEMKEDGNVTGFQLTTATSDWSTFDTVGGYRPEDDGSLEFKPGHILRRFKDEESDLKNEALVIDEINRANIDKAFGQLFTVLSGQRVQLPFTKGDEDKEVEVVPGKEFEKPVESHEFVVPESWRILATMNTYDKTSLYEMSYAFMRRFSFIRIEAPSIPEESKERAELLDEYIKAWGMSVTKAPAENVGEIWYRVNNAVEGREIGPAIAKDMLEFLDESGTGEASNTAAITNFIFPQLEGVPDRKKIVESLADADIDLDQKRLEKVAQNMLQVDLSGEE